jgi:hypothetical protein
MVNLKTIKTLTKETKEKTKKLEVERPYRRTSHTHTHTHTHILKD